jgi:PBP1b-binding outer membrane lipoprotein LpoB
MNRISILVAFALVLAGCSQSTSGVRITQGAPQASPAVVQAAPKSEPVFYNGKIYQINFEPVPSGGYAMAVSGMSAAQQKDAVAVSTSSLRQFACKEKQSGKLLTQPIYSDSKWRMTAHCV